jgi:hypothetical protein
MSAGSEGRRALLASLLGAALGLIAVVFGRRGDVQRKGARAWRDRSKT